MQPNLVFASRSRVIIRAFLLTPMSSPIPPNAPRWEPSTDPDSIAIPGLDTNASVNDQVDQIEQLITIKLQVGSVSSPASEHCNESQSLFQEHRCQLCAHTTDHVDETTTCCKKVLRFDGTRERGGQGSLIRFSMLGFAFLIYFFF